MVEATRLYRVKVSNETIEELLGYSVADMKVSGLPFSHSLLTIVFIVFLNRIHTWERF